MIACEFRESTQGSDNNRQNFTASHWSTNCMMIIANRISMIKSFLAETIFPTSAVFFCKGDQSVLDDQQLPFCPWGMELCINQQTPHNIFHIHLSRIPYYFNLLFLREYKIIVPNYADFTILNWLQKSVNKSLVGHCQYTEFPSKIS